MIKRIISAIFLVSIFAILGSSLLYSVRTAKTVYAACNYKEESMQARSVAGVLDVIVDAAEKQQSTIHYNINVVEQSTIPEKIEYTKFTNHDSAITFTQEYISEGDVMPYALYTPSNVQTNIEKPLIVWLHGLGEVNVNSEVFLNAGLPVVLNDWQMEGFNSYIICPHLTGNWNFGNWCTDSAKNNLKALLDKFILEHNVDTDNIVIAGHSLGGQGAMYMAYELKYYFSRCAVLNGYCPGIDISEITIPTIGCVGQFHLREDACSIYYMESSFASVFGSENLFSIPASHGEVPKVAFNVDENDNDRSDLVEWMLDELTY